MANYHIYGTGELKENCFRTISEAAQIAIAGDVVTVHNGIYREWVNPQNAGASAEMPIIYRAAEGENVVISGAEVITDWEQTKDNIWVTTIDNAFFGDYNPYKTLLSGDWYHVQEVAEHTGEVYIDGKSMYEVNNIADVISPKVHEKSKDPDSSLYVWCCESDDNYTKIFANFQDKNPQDYLIEISVRQHCFFPEKNGINFITVENFTMCHTATQWAPPTAYQPGLIGPNWSKGWVIKNNTIHDAKCCGISLGKCRDFGDNEWSKNKVKHGSQTQREVVFKALKGGWSKETIGSHTVTGNTIYNCEQAGIIGHLGCAFCVITNNNIYDIHTKHTFEGLEIAGIKLHAAIDTVIENNHMDNCFRGLWLDWQAQGAIVSKNLFTNNDEQDLFIEVCHGPFVVDNNILLSKMNLLDASQGGAYIHNLFTGEIMLRTVPDRFTHYHFAHETGVAGMTIIRGGDNRYISNVFIKAYDEIAVGLGVYDVYPTPTEAETQFDTVKSPGDYAGLTLPMFCENNLYLNGATPYRDETNSVVINDTIEFAFSKDGKSFACDYLKYAVTVKDTAVVTSDKLGAAFESEAVYENSDGSKIIIDKDYNANPINTLSPTVGPFAVQ